MPNVFVIAGPNGAGKSTAAPRLIGQRLGIAAFVNADVIAAGLSAFAPETVAIQAGRGMLARLHELADGGKDFAFETTLASRSFASWLARLRIDQGYQFHLSFLWLPSAETAVKRVASRVRAGGHAVRPHDIRRRYQRGLNNFFSLYAPIADSWELHDNSTLRSVLIAAREGRRPLRIENQALWERIQGQMAAKEQDGKYGSDPEPRLMGVPVSEVMEIFREAGKEACLKHKALGLPVVIWRDGKVVEVPPEEIEL